VRNLAERSAASASETHQKLSSSESLAAAAFESASNIATILTSIEEHIGRASVSVTSIAEATRDQSTALEFLGAAIADLEKLGNLNKGTLGSCQDTVAILGQQLDLLKREDAEEWATQEQGALSAAARSESAAEVASAGSFDFDLGGDATSVIEAPEAGLDDFFVAGAADEQEEEEDADAGDFAVF